MSNRLFHMAAMNMFLFPMCCVFLLMGIARGEEAKSAPPLKMPASTQELDKVKPIKPGYLVTIKILEDKRDALQQIVAITGEVQAPYLGLIKADGLTCRELAYQIKTGLEKDFFKEATVVITSGFRSIPRRYSCPFDPEFVVAFGNVTRQGKYDLPFDTTVSSLLLRAGGCTVKGGIQKILIIRKTPQGNKRILVNAQAILNGKSQEYDLFLRPYDVVIVE